MAALYAIRARGCVAQLTRGKAFYGYGAAKFDLGRLRDAVTRGCTSFDHAAASTVFTISVSAICGDCFSVAEEGAHPSPLRDYRRLSPLRLQPPLDEPADGFGTR